MADIPLIHVRLLEGASALAVSRDEGVPAEFWLLLRAEWGSWGRTPSRAVEVPLERFLARRAWLGPACKRHRVGIDWDGPSRDLLLDARRQRDELDDAVQNPNESVDEGETRERLDVSRFSRTLRAFQLRDLRRLLRLHYGANFSVPGAGKTAVTYALYELERSAGRVERLLVVAPISAFDAWTTEAQECFDAVPSIHRFDGSIPEDTEVLLVNYQRLSGSYDQLAAWVSESRTHAVLDEAHRMKRGRTGQWGTACLDLAYLAARRDILTGTPAPHSPVDLEALLNFIWPNQARRVLPADVLVPRPLPNAVQRAGEAIAPLFVRTTKDELALPPVHYRVEQIDLTGIHADIYAALLDQYAGAMSMQDRLNFTAMGRITMYLLEAATNPALLPVGSSRYDAIEFRHPPLSIPPGSRLADLIEQYGQFETPRKLIRLAELVRENASQARKTLVWSNFVRNLATLHRMLGALEPALVHGGIPSGTAPGTTPTREDEIARFRDDSSGCMVLLANPAAMSEGISLHQTCHDAIYIERTFNAGQYLQSLDRIHRLGLRPEEETRITFLLTAGTVDEVVDRRVREKAERLSHMLRDPGIIELALPDDDDYGPVVETDQDLVELFRHLRGEDAA